MMDPTVKKLDEETNYIHADFKTTLKKNPF